VAHNNIKFNHITNRFQTLAEEHNEEDRGSDRVKEGSVSAASSSRGSRMRDPVTLTPEILAMLDRHEPDKVKKNQVAHKALSWP